MSKKFLLKRFLPTLFSSIIFINSSLCLNASAVETYRSWRYGMGDVFEDNDRQDGKDLMSLKKHILGSELLSSTTKLNSADVKIDFKVNGADLLTMQKCIIGNSGYNDTAIDDLHVAISNCDSDILKNMRDIIGAFMYKHHEEGWVYDANNSKYTFNINGETFENCRIDCSTAVSLALLMSGVLNPDKLNLNKLSKYLNTTDLVKNFSIIKNCTNPGYELDLISLVPNATFIQPGDILVYPNGHTAVVVSTTAYDMMPTSLSSGNSANVSVYSAGGDFTAVHNYRLRPESETIDQGSSGNAQGIRPYKFIIRVSKT